MSDYADWQGIDRGHEGYWERSVWMGVLMVLNECGGSADFLNENSVIYTLLDEKIPQAEWHSIESNGSWRSNFRDAREPWTGLGVISFDETQMKLTEDGRRLLTGEKSFSEIICDTARTYLENNENPFAILASVFLDLPINQGLSIDDVVKIMRHYRPNTNDDLQNVLLENPEEISQTGKRRLRHILRLLTFAGGIVFDSNLYYVASKQILKTILTKESFSLEQIKKQFIQWLEINCRGSESFKNDMVKIIESWLDRKMPGDAIGNLFRFSNSSEYEAEKARIMALPNFEVVNQANQNGRPKTALNHYENFLRSIESKGLVDENLQTQTTYDTVSHFTPAQIIYYGVPGCGKSNKIKELLQNVSEKNKVRVVFHPEYTNADFIGQILPKVNGHVTYEFTAGPFAQIIKKAYLNPNEKFYLVIEEINRGNAAAIFGDTFQLLDRLKAGETDSLGNDSSNANVNTFTEGWSQYFVQNDDVNEYIRKAVRADDGKYEDSTENVLAEIEINGIHFTANTAIRLPPNLSILATMNTSDQNVFTLDNAFQRRFDMELIRNEFDMTKDAVRVQYDSEIDDTGITWGKFWTWINSKITAMLKGLSSTEDKRIGVWFVSNVNGKIDDKIFAEKVLKYLWDDVFKFKRKDIFADEIDTLEKLIDKFEKAEGAARFDVFKKDAALNG